MEFHEILNKKLDSLGRDYVWLCAELRFRVKGLENLWPETAKNWVTGWSIPRRSTMAEIARILEMPIDELCGTPPAGSDG